ncbi:type II toxin-antitoxin system VapC family toxin [Ferrovibrio xuzhouensis]|uniref:Type II toxin-antitoxin system VapC family toxin n=1 Tax=Ferrovibrio xuzhouensis TaxID=1576914 RepID=A0ABV7VKM4_9PROT
MYILDTNVLSATHYIRPPPTLMAWLASVPSTEIATTAITIAEIQAGIESMRATGKKGLPEVKKWLYQAVLPVVQVVPFTTEAALIFAKMHARPQIRHQMQPGRQSSRKVLLEADVMIAAVAISMNAVIVTRNVCDFLQVEEHFALPGLYDPIADVWHVRPRWQEELRF